MARLHVLEARRALLVCRSAEQREQLAGELIEWQARAQAVDRWLTRIYRFRVVAGAAAAIVAVLGIRSRRRVSTWIRGASLVWGIVRVLRKKSSEPEE